MRLDVELAGADELQRQLAHARDGILQLDTTLAAELEADTPPTLVYESLDMRARAWGPGDVWTLPAGGWLAPRVKLPTDVDEKLTETVQQLLDG